MVRALLTGDRMKYWEIIADNLSKAGWRCGYMSVMDKHADSLCRTTPTMIRHCSAESFVTNVVATSLWTFHFRHISRRRTTPPLQVRLLVADITAKLSITVETCKCSIAGLPRLVLWLKHTFQ